MTKDQINEAVQARIQIQVGLERPKDWDNAKMFDFNEMRKAIFAARRDSALIHQCLMTADYNGLSAEDRYTLMAYEALIALETYWKMANEILMKNPMPPILMRES